MDCQCLGLTRKAGWERAKTCPCVRVMQYCVGAPIRELARPRAHGKQPPPCDLVQTVFRSVAIRVECMFGWLARCWRRLREEDALPPSSADKMYGCGALGLFHASDRPCRAAGSRRAPIYVGHCFAPVSDMRGRAVYDLLQTKRAKPVLGAYCRGI